ncbi:leucyl aminopeptidase [Auriscalpium vulgare]|uniref:Leucyl aminopeptidase n=1 Tax=Auriscalpium vulgare TaxID=40419 RepID=A0ACB8S481_9AGAM|nr:leucyl aminopeptidase [Auriscalpium vulgare]
MSITVKPLDAYRLPTNVRATHYDLIVRTDLEKETFEGSVTINIEVVEPTDSIVLNAASVLVLSSVSLSLTGSADLLTPSRTSHDEPTQRVSYTFPKTLSAGTTGSLRIDFSSTLTDSLVGYYKSSWDKGTYALTHFQPTGARHAFPCWDEPLLKATFSVTLISRADTVSLSNMPALNEPVVPARGAEALFTGVAEKEWTATKFATTPLMSTYIVAFANGPFAFLESSYTSPLSGKVRPLRIYATPDVIHQAQFALDITAKAVPLYETVFNVEYPLPKLDTLVVNDFDFGAMENWGLIMGRTVVYLMDPNNLNMRAKKQIASTQCHEIAHMWFGNITTMAWWDNLYLNEGILGPFYAEVQAVDFTLILPGFATLMGESIILDKIFPEWKVDTEFINDHLNSALRLDARPSSHPIEVDCPDSNQIQQIFDGLSYAKGASVLRMLSKHVGEDKFLKGVSIYLKKHLFANSVSRDLWEGIGEVTGTDIPKLMDAWVTKIGFPVVTVTETGDAIRVRQDRFLEDGAAKPQDNETIWTVPLSILTTSAAGQSLIDNTVVLDAREKEFKVDLSKPFKLNGNTNGVFRVLYTPERLAAIGAEAAKPDSVFSLNDRIGLVHDALALSKAGYQKDSTTLNLIYALRGETEYLVWDGIATNLGMMVGTWWENTYVKDTLNALRRQLFFPIVERLGYEYSADDTPDTTQLRSLAIELCANAKHPEVVKELRDRFARYVTTAEQSAIPADLLNAAFRVAVIDGGVEAYDAVVKIYENSRTPSEKNAAIRALGFATDKALLDRTLDTVLNKARNQDTRIFLGGLAANEKARRSAVTFLEENWATFEERFAASMGLKFIVSAVYSSFTAEADRLHVEQFFAGKDISKFNLVLAQVLDSIKTKAAWIKRSTADIEHWLECWEKTSRF